MRADPSVTRLFRPANDNARDSAVRVLAGFISIRELIAEQLEQLRVVAERFEAEVAATCRARGWKDDADAR